MLQLTVASVGGAVSGGLLMAHEHLPIVPTRDPETRELSWQQPEQEIPALDVLGAALIAVSALSFVAAKLQRRG